MESSGEIPPKSKVNRCNEQEVYMTCNWSFGIREAAAWKPQFPKGYPGRPHGEVDLDKDLDKGMGAGRQAGRRTFETGSSRRG